MSKSALMDNLICPACRHDLVRGDEELNCPGCDRTYRFIAGVPVLLAEHNEVLLHPEAGKPPRRRGPLKRTFDRLIEALPDSYRSPVTRENMAFIAENLPSRPVTLAVGGGIQSYGKDIDLLGGKILANFVNLEVEPGPVVDIVADGHAIPFPDASFDFVVSQAVLEHVRDPRRVVAEMRRVLKPGGWIFVDVPFLQCVHMYSDFWRYTPRGLSELMKDFTVVRQGVNAGLGTAAATVNSEFLAAIFSFGNPTLFRRLVRLFRRLMFGFSWFDPLFSGTRLPDDGPSSIFIVGRK